MGAVPKNVFAIKGLDNKSAPSKNAQKQDEFVVEKRFQHIGRKPNEKYVVRCYSYRSHDDTVEKPRHTPEHYIEQNWRGRSTKSKTNSYEIF